jgi:hypothetical protein
MRSAVIILVLPAIGLAIALVLTDRGLRLLVQRKVADRVAAAWWPTARPSVTLPGFPFLTQLVAGRYHEVDVAVSSVAQAGVQFEDFRARFTGVRAPLGGLFRTTPATITAAEATATALVPLGSLGRRLPAGLTLNAANGRLRLHGSIGYQGFQMPVSAGLSLRVTPDAIEFSPRDVRVGGAFSVPAGLLGSMLAFALPIGDLPLPLRLTGVVVTEAGFEVSALARGVALVTRADG